MKAERCAGSGADVYASPYTHTAICPQCQRKQGAEQIGLDPSLGMIVEHAKGSTDVAVYVQRGGAAKCAICQDETRSLYRANDPKRVVLVCLRCFQLEAGGLEAQLEASVEATREETANMTGTCAACGIALHGDAIRKRPATGELICEDSAACVARFSAGLLGKREAAI